jgi:CO/xanthine dehydrogenase FAD-binding subunit
MKAADFDYFRAGSIAEACRALADGGHEARLIAGGQTLVPLMAMRLARPQLLVDINRIAELQGVMLQPGALAIKACTTQAEALDNPLVKTHAPLLAKALPFVGHGQTRNRGTIGGSLANADPAAEIAIVAVALDCEIDAQSISGKRTIACRDFFKGAMTTALRPDECLIEARFPIWPERGAIGTGFEEMSVRRSDFALVAVAVQLFLDKDGTCRRAAIGVGGLGGIPVSAAKAANGLIGSRVDDRDVEAAVDALQPAIQPHSDIHASAEYRRRVAGTLFTRAVVAARDEALRRL